MKRLVISSNLIYASFDLVNSSVFKGTPFKPDTTTSYYNDFLDSEELKYMQEAKNRTGEIVMMSPNEYISECSTKIFIDQNGDGRHSMDDLKEQRYASKYNDTQRLVDKYAEDMKSGDKFPLCYLNYADNGQEGLHRMMAAGQVYGWDTKFPVLVVTAYDQDIENKRQTMQDCSYFEKWYFDSICEEAADNISDWHNPPPDNFVDQYRDEIIKVASTFTDDGDGPFDIDVVVEIETVDDMPQVRVYLSRYSTYELPTISNPYTVWLNDMYEIDKPADSDVSSRYPADEMSEEEIQDEISKLLFI